MQQLEILLPTHWTEDEHVMLDVWELNLIDWPWYGMMFGTMLAIGQQEQ